MKNTWFIYILLFLSTVINSAENIIEYKSIVFSEMTVDIPPGEDESWIELYNQSDIVINCQGYSIFCNNHLIFTFPPNYIVSPKGIVLIKYAKNEADKEISNNNIDSSNPVQIVVSPIVGIKLDKSKIELSEEMTRILKLRPSKIIEERVPGYCALYTTGSKREKLLVDYVSWGKDKYQRKYPEIFNDVIELAKRNDLNYTPVNIGMEYLGGEIFIEDYATINRKCFKQDNIKNCLWSANDISNATPGYGNTWPPPCNTFISNDVLNEGEKLKISVLQWYDNRFIEYLMKSFPKTKVSSSEELYEKLKIKVRLQIAKDPHFEEVIYNNMINPKCEIKIDLKPGVLFARIRIDMEQICTDWSRAETIIIRSSDKINQDK